MRDVNYNCDGCGKEVIVPEQFITIKSGMWIDEGIYKELCADCSEDLVDELSEPSKSILESVVEWVRDR